MNNYSCVCREWCVCVCVCVALAEQTFAEWVSGHPCFYCRGDSFLHVCMCGCAGFAPWAAPPLSRPCDAHTGRATLDGTYRPYFTSINSICVLTFKGTSWLSRAPLTTKEPCIVRAVLSFMCLASELFATETVNLCLFSLWILPRCSCSTNRAPSEQLLYHHLFPGFDFYHFDINHQKVAVMCPQRTPQRCSV